MLPLVMTASYYSIICRQHSEQDHLKLNVEIFAVCHITMYRPCSSKCNNVKSYIATYILTVRINILFHATHIAGYLAT